MPIATPEIYSEMIDRAKAGGFAYPAVNVTSSQTLNATLQGFADAGSPCRASPMPAPTASSRFPPAGPPTGPGPA